MTSNPYLPLSKRLKAAWRVLTAKSGSFSGAPTLRAFLDDDNPAWSQPSYDRPDKVPAQRMEDLRNALLAWQTNPLARRIVNLTRDHVWGRGIRPVSKIKIVQKWLDKFWDHPMNFMDERIPVWVDALTTDGEIFPTFHTNPADGMTYLRALSAAQIQDVTWSPNDYEQLTGIGQLIPGQLDLHWWKTILDAQPTEPAAWQYAVNRPLGAIRGDGDITPALPWLAAYSDWLDSRVKRNKVLSKFYYEVTIDDADDVPDAQARYSRPPADGTVVVHSAAEHHNVIQPKIAADDAKSDGAVLRTMIAVGGNIPLHWLAEAGEGNSEATSANMNDVSYRFYYTRQRFVARRIEHLCTYAYNRAAALGAVRHFADPEIHAVSSDISREDNQKLASAARDIAQAFGTMIEKGLDQDQQIVRLIYRFAGEDLDDAEITDIVARAKRRIASSVPSPEPPSDSQSPSELGTQNSELTTSQES